ncbi:C39 family peptidase [bacterium]|nr:C39 family peptidase [bacterium]
MADHEFFRVDPFTSAKFLTALCEGTGEQREAVEQKRQIRFLRDHLERLGAHTIVVEKKYIDHDYMEDYAAYYVRCFAGYSRECRRIHFFSKRFSDTDLLAVLRGNDAGCMGMYLGFIVVRPIPYWVIGRTCVQAPGPTQNPNALLPVLRPYCVNLFGLKLNLNSLAFQEQDRSVSVCATSALWTALQQTAKKYQHTVPSPVEITRISHARFPSSVRELPISSLNSEQLAGAISYLGMDPFFVNVQQDDDQLVLRKAIYTYLKAGIPAILIINNLGTGNPREANIKHAVTISGFNLGMDLPEPRPGKFLTTDGRIDTIYVHDDQIGPFAEMNFQRPQKKGVQSTLSSPWSSQAGQIQAIPDKVLFPLHKKIRVPFDAIYAMVETFFHLLDSIDSTEFDPIEWDIFLTELNDFRDDVVRNKLLITRPDLIETIITSPAPRFMYRATAKLNKTPIFDLLFDATDIRNGDTFLKSIFYNPDWELKIVRTLKTIPESELAPFKTTPAWPIIVRLRKPR